MGCAVYESYYIKETELKVLLAGTGVKQIYGLFSDGHNQMLQKTEANQILASLYHRDAIDWHGDAVLAKQPFASLLSVLKASTCCFLLHGKRQECPLRCSYVCGDRVVVMEKSQREADTLCFSHFAKDDWLEWMAETVHFFDETAGLCDGMPHFLEGHFRDLQEDTPNYFEQEEIQWVYTVWDAAGTVCRAKIFLHQDVYGCITVETPSSTRTCFYTKEMMCQVLKEYMEGKR